MLNYKWKTASFNADATAVGQEIEKIEDEGTVDRYSVLDYAKKNEDSELHKCFEWDDAIAGEKYRLFQSNQILSSISIVTKERDENQDEETIRAYVSIKTEDDVRNYKSIYRVMEKDDEYNQLKQKAYNEFLGSKDKYEKLLDKDTIKEILFDLYKNM